MATIAIYCGSHRRIDHRHLQRAADLGALAARRRYAVLIGGGLVSCIGSVADAARRNGAPVRCVLPSAVMALDPPDRLPDDTVVVDDIWTWKREIDRLADAFVVLPGGLGTLAELFEAWSGAVLGAHRKPVVVVDAERVLEPVRKAVQHLVANGFARDRVMEAVHWTDSVTDALDHIDAWRDRGHFMRGDTRRSL